MADYGMRFAAEGKDLARRTTDTDAYKTDNDIIQVSIDKTPPHLGLIIPLPKATAYTLTTVDGNDVQWREEVLFQIEHNMPFRPDYVCYFYCTDSPYPVEIGSYRLDYYRVGFGGEYLQALTDDKYFKIVHSVRVQGAPGAGATYPFTYNINGASQRSYRVKYMILQRPDMGQLDYAAV